MFPLFLSPVRQEWDAQQTRFHLYLSVIPATVVLFWQFREAQAGWCRIEVFPRERNLVGWRAEIFQTCRCSWILLSQQILDSWEWIIHPPNPACAFGSPGYCKPDLQCLMLLPLPSNLSRAAPNVSHTSLSEEDMGVIHSLILILLLFTNLSFLYCFSRKSL